MSSNSESGHMMASLPNIVMNRKFTNMDGEDMHSTEPLIAAQTRVRRSLKQAAQDIIQKRKASILLERRNEQLAYDVKTLVYPAIDKLAIVEGGEVADDTDKVKNTEKIVRGFLQTIIRKIPSKETLDIESSTKILMKEFHSKRQQRSFIGGQKTANTKISSNMFRRAALRVRSKIKNQSMHSVVQQVIRLHNMKMLDTSEPESIQRPNSMDKQTPTKVRPLAKMSPEGVYATMKCYDDILATSLQQKYPDKWIPLRFQTPSSVDLIRNNLSAQRRPSLSTITEKSSKNHNTKGTRPRRPSDAITSKINKELIDALDMIDYLKSLDGYIVTSRRFRGKKIDPLYDYARWNRSWTAMFETKVQDESL